MTGNLIFCSLGLNCRQFKEKSFGLGIAISCVHNEHILLILNIAYVLGGNWFFGKETIEGSKDMESMMKKLDNISPE